MPKTMTLCALCLAVLCVTAVSGQETREAEPGKPLLLLTIAVDLDTPATNLIFEARNAGDKDIETTPIGTGGNWVEVQRPDGKTERIQLAVKIAYPISVKAGESRTWQLDLVREGGIKFDAAGRYRLTWHLQDLRNLGAWKAEIYLVKSKGGPVDK